MPKQERIKSINERAVLHLQNLLEQLENKEVTPDDLLASLYGASVAAYLLGYSPDALVHDAKAGAERLMELLKETENEQNA
jgi:hypothetical protein